MLTVPGADYAACNSGLDWGKSDSAGRCSAPLSEQRSRAQRSVGRCSAPLSGQRSRAQRNRASGRARWFRRGLNSFWGPPGFASSDEQGMYILNCPGHGQPYEDGTRPQPDDDSRKFGGIAMRDELGIEAWTPSHTPQLSAPGAFGEVAEEHEVDMQGNKGGSSGHHLVQCSGQRLTGQGKIDERLCLVDVSGHHLIPCKSQCISDVKTVVGHLCQKAEFVGFEEEERDVNDGGLGQQLVQCRGRRDEDEIEAGIPSRLSKLSVPGGHGDEFEIKKLRCVGFEKEETDANDGGSGHFLARNGDQRDEVGTEPRTPSRTPKLPAPGALRSSTTQELEVDVQGKMSGSSRHPLVQCSGQRLTSQGKIDEWLGPVNGSGHHLLPRKSQRAWGSTSLVHEAHAKAEWHLDWHPFDFLMTDDVLAVCYHAAAQPYGDVLHHGLI